MQRAEIERQTAEYLARGGEITHIPRGHSAHSEEPIKRTRRETIEHVNRRPLIRTQGVDKQP